MVQWWCQLRPSPSVGPAAPAELASQAAQAGIHAWLVPVVAEPDGGIQPAQLLQPLVTAASAGGPAVGLLLHLPQPLSPRAEAELALHLACWMAQPGALRLARQPVLLLGSTAGFSHAGFGPRRLRLGLQRELRRLGVGQDPWLVGPQPSPLWDSTLFLPAPAPGDYRIHLQRAHHGPWPPGPFIPVVPVPQSGAGDGAAALYQEWLEQAGAAATCQAKGAEHAVLLLPDWQAHRQWMPAMPPSRLRPTAGEGDQPRQAPAAITAADADVVRQAWGEPHPHHLAVLVHGFYPDRLAELLGRLRGPDSDSPGPALDLYVSTPKAQQSMVGELLRGQGWPRVQLYGVENRGRDMAPFLLQLLPDALRNGHELFVKVHTKRSGHLSDGDAWAEHLLGSLLDPAALQHWLAMLAADPQLGLLAPAGTLLACSVALHANVDHLMALCDRCGISPETLLQRRFIAGSMMAGRLEAIANLPGLGFQLAEFEQEQGQTDGTLAHALERWLCCEAVLRGWRLQELPGEARGVPGFGHGQPEGTGPSTALNLELWSALLPPDAL